LTRSRRLCFAVWLACLVLGLAVVAPSKADDFPSRPVRLIMGFGAGGLGDIAGRAIGQKMSESLGKPVVVENLPGAGGMMAAGALIRSPADGHAMLWVSGQNAIARSMFKSLSYDWASDFALVGPIGTFDFVMIVAKDSPLKSVADVIAAAKANPSKFNFGTIAVGTAQNLSAQKFVSMMALGVPTVPFRTTGEVVTGLISGSIQVAFETLPGVIGQIQGGSLRAIAVTSERRTPYLPDVPTIAESGVPNYRVFSWNGIAVVTKTPRPLIDRLNKELALAVNSPEVSKRLKELAIDARTGTPEDLQKIYDDDVALWRQVFIDAKIQPQ
jgi:tripartite-type tricarboxylate transporter receptor subunit TctC